MNLSASSPVILAEPIAPSTRLNNLIRTIEQDNHCSPQRIRQHILDAGLSAQDLQAWSDFKHATIHSYGRKAVYESRYLEVMVMSWDPGDFSAIHDHGHAQWGAVQCFGEAEHSIYVLDGDVLRTVAIEPCHAKAVHAVNPELIHQMGNPGKSSFLSLHIYGRQEPADFITGDAQIFELFEGCKQLTNGGAFFCLPEEQIVGRRSGLRGDRATTLRHHHQLRDRIQRILAEQEKDGQPGQSALKTKLDQLQIQINFLSSY